MEQTHAPSLSGSALTTRVLIAMAAAAVILIGFVLPAEYGIDPTGVGKAMGLTALGGAQPEGIPVLPLAPPEQAHYYDQPWHSDEVKVTLGPDKEIEYKFRMKKGESIVYSWTSDTNVYYDFHAESEPKPGESKETFKRQDLRYKEEQDGAKQAHGALTSPFDGIHGWYWLNLEGKPTTITVKVSGFYSLRGADEQPTEAK